MTITDFIRARIADDEALWGPEVNDLVMGGIARRMLAEVAAKRQLVEDWQMHAQQEGPEARTVARVLLSALCVLAAVYADHPDYDESWRP